MNPTADTSGRTKGVMRSTTHLGETTPRLINPASVVTEGSERRRRQRDNAHSTTGRTHIDGYKHWLLALVILTHCIHKKIQREMKRDAREKSESRRSSNRRYKRHEDNFTRLNAAPSRFFVRSRVDRDAMINDVGGCESPLFREPHSGHYTLAVATSRERSVFCSFFFFSFFYGGDDDMPVRREVTITTALGRLATGGATRSTNRAPAFTERHLAPYPSTKMLPNRTSPNVRGNARSSLVARFYLPLLSPPQRRWIDVRFAASLLRRCPNFRYGDFMAGLSAKRATRLYIENCLGSDSSVSQPAYHPVRVIAPNNDCFTKRGASDKSLLSFHSCMT